MFAAQRMFNVINHLQTNLMGNQQDYLGEYGYIHQSEQSDPLKKQRGPSTEAEKPKKGKSNNDNNDNNGGGGLLEPIIQDIKGWMGRKRQGDCVVSYWSKSAPGSAEKSLLTIADQLSEARLLHGVDC